jgi:S1-C subfamily serine protease
MRSNVRILFLALMAIVIGATTLVACFGAVPAPRIEPPQIAPPVQAPQAQAPQAQAPNQASASFAAVSGGIDVSDVYERVSPAVVNITISARMRDAFGRTQQAEGTGSGVIIDDQGHVVTNHHVAGGANRLDVTLADNTSYVANLVASDQANDLALLKINAPAEKLRELTVARLGDSDALKVGQAVIAIGNPFGLERSASFGIVSSVGRTRPGEAQRLISNMIQTDAAINPGNSGGPLLNVRGEVIGINEQIEAPTRGNVGVGFAIPVNTLKRYLPELLSGREPSHAYIGVAGGPLTPTMAEQIHAPVAQGVILANVVPGGPAARAGLRGAQRGDPATGDIIVALDGQSMRSVEDVAAYIDKKEPSDTVRVTYVRGNQTSDATVTLDAWQPSQTVGR